jgi:AraC-like DNA-binding protein
VASPRGSGLTVSALQAQAVLSTLRSLDIDAEAVLERAGIAADAIGDPRARLPRENMLAMWEAARQLSGEPAFGLRVAERIVPAGLDVLVYLARSAGTLGEVVRGVGRYARLLDDAAEIQLSEQDGLTTLRPRLTDGEPISGGAMECFFAFGVRLSREVTGQSLQPVRVDFTHRAPDDTSEYRRLFGGLVTFEADLPGLTFASAQLDLPIVTADPGLSRILTRHADELLQELGPADHFNQRVRSLIVELLPGQDATLKRIAQRMAMSERTLRRKLQENGTSLHALRDEVRVALAVRYLADSRLTFEQIAHQLGFADARAFRRAYKRWTGRSPRDDRAR